MAGYLIRRAATGLMVLWVVVTATFALMHAIPGGPFTGDRVLPEAVLRNLEVRYGLDKPLAEQYLNYLANLGRGDLGLSFKEPTRTVNEIIREGLPVSATLGAISIGLAILLGVPAGVLAALRQNRWQDGLAMLVSTLLVSTPSFILGTLLIYVFALKLRWFPPAFWKGPQHAVLPAIALAGFPTAFIARLVRSSMLEALGQDYVRTARSKGLPAPLVVFRHALRNAILPAVTVMGPLSASILTGSLVIEKIFGLPGIGGYYVTSIFNRDYAVILGMTILYSVLLIAFNVLTDLAYGWIDPRVRLATARRA